LQANQLIEEYVLPVACVSHVGIGNKTFGSVEQFKRLGITITNQKFKPGRN
jgi:hypothetical protein